MAGKSNINNNNSNSNSNGNKDINTVREISV